MEKLDITAARHDPAVQVLSPLVHVRSTNPSEAADCPLKSNEHFRHSVRICLVHTRVRLACPAALGGNRVRPTLAIEEPRGPGELVSIHDVIENTSARRWEGMTCRTFVRQAVARSCDEASPR
jgi:hypothetical protein